MVKRQGLQKHAKTANENNTKGVLLSFGAMSFFKCGAVSSPLPSSS
ncbi:16319_t:CDS:1, partial [Funneliformis caledonium]